MTDITETYVENRRNIQTVLDYHKLAVAIPDDLVCTQVVINNLSEIFNIYSRFRHYSKRRDRDAKRIVSRIPEQLDDWDDNVDMPHRTEPEKEFYRRLLSAIRAAVEGKVP